MYHEDDKLSTLKERERERERTRCDWMDGRREGGRMKSRFYDIIHTADKIILSHNSNSGLTVWLMKKAWRDSVGRVGQPYLQTSSKHTAA